MTMANPSFELRELFHLSLLRHLAPRLSGRAWALKGGICLRFFHRSPRLSQDMDLDVISGVRAQTLEKAVDSILASKSFIASLMPYGIRHISVTKPKQTQTTQRWKAAMELSGSVHLPTKIEFSRRRVGISCSSGVPDAQLLNHYKMPPFAAQYYGGGQMAAQKIAALASPGRYAVRDLFDLHHLFYVINVRPEESSHDVNDQTIEKALSKSGGFTYKDFKEQVLPYLCEELMDLYKTSEAFEKLKGEVEQKLMGIL
ncbi:MAG: nucleotidyl transferase AbiEii/AbiGii toxin family protein [Elusimicrobia bacterium]|nr:nucleotidyl transferase AbiEii/AbiGii toxin family protein [Elusimicrobiota bacterium]